MTADGERGGWNNTDGERGACPGGERVARQGCAREEPD